MNTWALQDAKAKFSQMVDTAHRGPQLVTRRGREAVVVMDIEHYKQLANGRDSRNLVQFFRRSPLGELPPQALSRSTDSGRKVVL